jgi:hypothetical protein
MKTFKELYKKSPADTLKDNFKNAFTPDLDIYKCIQDNGKKYKGYYEVVFVNIRATEVAKLYREFEMMAEDEKKNFNVAHDAFKDEVIKEFMTMKHLHDRAIEGTNLTYCYTGLTKNKNLRFELKRNK